MVLMRALRRFGYPPSFWVQRRRTLLWRHSANMHWSPFYSSDGLMRFIKWVNHDVQLFLYVCLGWLSVFSVGLGWTETHQKGLGVSLMCAGHQAGRNSSCSVYIHTWWVGLGPFNHYHRLESEIELRLPLLSIKGVDMNPCIFKT